MSGLFGFVGPNNFSLVGMTTVIMLVFRILCYSAYGFIGLVFGHRPYIVSFIMLLASSLVVAALEARVDVGNDEEAEIRRSSNARRVDDIRVGG